MRPSKIQQSRGVTTINSPSATHFTFSYSTVADLQDDWQAACSTCVSNNGRGCWRSHIAQQMWQLRSANTPLKFSDGSDGRCTSVWLFSLHDFIHYSLVHHLKEKTSKTRIGWMLDCIKSVCVGT